MSRSTIPSLVCPFCGPRPLEEFLFRKTQPNAGGGAFEAVYLRVDSAERSVEEWQHVGGCRGWLRMVRNPSTGEVLEVSL
jgi:heterotetrameric sarcosine oxidase delta subunit